MSSLHVKLARLRMATCMLLALAISAPAIAAKKEEAAKEDLSAVHQKLEALKKELDASTGAHKEAADALKDSELAISLAQKKLYQINQQQKQNSTALHQLKKQTLSVSEQLAQQQQQLSQQLQQQYRHGNQTYPQLLLNNQDPNRIARDLKYYAYIAKARSELIVGMQNNLTKIQTLNAETAKTLQQVAALKAKQEAEKQALEQQKRAKANVVKSLSQKIATQRQEISKLKRDEKSLSSLVARLAQQAKLAQQKKIAKALAAKKRMDAERKIAQQKTKQAKTKPNQSKAAQSNNAASQPIDTDTAQNNTVVASNDTLPDQGYTGISFAKLKGKLRLPVRGNVSNRFGASRADTGVSWKGLFIKSSEGSEVKSVADGQVVFADWMRGFGNLIIVDHGSGYMSLYGNNQALLKGVGDDVGSGDTIAAVGNSGGNESNGLYYELRKNSVPFDPLKWSALR